MDLLEVLLVVAGATALSILWSVVLLIVAWFAHSSYMRHRRLTAGTQMDTLVAIAMAKVTLEFTRLIAQTVEGAASAVTGTISAIWARIVPILIALTLALLGVIILVFMPSFVNAYFTARQCVLHPVASGTVLPVINLARLLLRTSVV